ncbi:hypothetical protein CBR_g4609 [Chara braunii]|uniref:Protein FRA10AC1 n=1 Tax=Chara braunii TaxID=69332 RepID=A0A388KID8_CHABU|nr:hypothetical protein CBR_g4609 [Chara braunii]|eukprot:GBG69778.1 hypothetical protein CBR_g4609 [Chara braunii]
MDALGKLANNHGAAGAGTSGEFYRFLRMEEDDADGSWDKQLAKRYDDKLYKEYCLADMSRYKESKIGLRWRTEKEVLGGKGQFICGNKKCKETKGLRSFEVNFVYKEAGEEKQALVKLRVCPKCSYRLNYRKEKELKAARKLDKERRRHERRREAARGKRKDMRQKKEAAFGSSERSTSELETDNSRESS